MVADLGRLLRRAGERDRPVEGGPRLAGASELHQEMSAGAVEIEIAAERIRERIDQRQRGCGAVDLGDRHRAIEGHHGRGLQPLQDPVERLDLAPVRVGGRFGPPVQGCDGRLDEIGAGPAVAEALVHQGQRLIDLRTRPQPPVLMLQEDRRSVRPETGGRPRLGQQHQGQKAHDLRLRREQAEQQPRETDRLVRERRPRALGGPAE